MKQLILIIIAVCLLASASLAKPLKSTGEFLHYLGKAKPISPPRVEQLYQTQEDKEDNQARFGMGLRTAILVLPNYALEVYFNRGHGLAVDVGLLNITSICYKKLINHQEDRRQYLALGGVGYQCAPAITPILKLSTEVGQYRGRNWLFEIGFPTIVGLGFMNYW